jgi:alkylhydroperoxidase/carboxymuconolactone decarboxylase family protein YurZ
MPNQKVNVKELPRSLRNFITKYPKVWTAHEKLGVECSRSGPLTERETQLVKLAITGSLSLETSFKTHVKKAIRARATKAEIEHTIIQMLPILGLARTMMAMKWYAEVSHPTRR